MTDKNEDHKSGQALRKPATVPGNTLYDSKDGKPNYSAVHENY